MPYRMNMTTAHIVRLFSITIVLMGIGVGLYAQSGCIGKDNACFKKTMLEGEEVEFKYYFIENENLSFENGEYILKINEKKSTKINLAVKNELSSIIYFNEKWLDPDDVFKYKSKEFTLSSSQKLRLIFNNKNQKNAKVILPFGIGEDESSINTSSDTLEFSFVIKGGKTPEEKTEEEAKKKKAEEEALRKAEEAVEKKVEKGTLTEEEEKRKAAEEVAKKKAEEEALRKAEEAVEKKVEKGTLTEEEEEEKKEALRKAEEEKRKADEAAVVEAWEQAKSQNTVKAYRDYEENYPDSLNRRIARIKRKKITRNSPLQTEDGYIITLKYVISPTVVSSKNATAKLYPIEGDEYSRELRITDIENQKNPEIVITDKGKANEVQYLPISLGKHLEVSVSLNNDNIQEVRFKNGVPPYKITFLPEKHTISVHKLQRTDYEIIHKDKDSLIAVWLPPEDFFEKKQLSGNITFTISDSELNEPYEDDKWTLMIPKGEKELGEEKKFKEILSKLGVGLIPLGFIFLYLTLQPTLKKKRRRKWEKERAEKWVSYQADIEPQKAAILENKIDVEEGGNEYKFENTQTQTEKPKIVIKGIRRAKAVEEYEDEKKLEKALLTERALSFTMAELWQDSCVSEIYFKEECINSLENFIQEQNLSPLNEGNTEIPEIGGIFMGKVYQHKSKNTYKVHTEQFVPINPEYHDVYRFEFSKESIAKDLGDIQKKYTDLILVGWFHTHPGHGLFLSKPDLRIHDSFFKESYQFAMEIDTISSRLDTAFFTRMKNNKVNNRKNLKEHAKWFMWSPNP